MTAVAEEKRYSIKGQKGSHKLLNETPGMCEVENERGDTFWVPRAKITEIIPQPKPRSLGAAAAADFDTNEKPERQPVHAAYLTDPLISFLRERSAVIRIFYPAHDEAHLFEDASAEGIILPADIRPIAHGARGGTEEQRAWSGSVSFPDDTPENLLPEGTKREAKGLMNHRRGVALALLKAGFPLTSYARA